MYVNGGYAGTADKLKTIWLDPGAYDLSLSAAGREPYRERIYVLSGKTLKIAAVLNQPQTSKADVDTTSPKLGDTPKP